MPALAMLATGLLGVLLVGAELPEAGIRGKILDADDTGAVPHADGEHDLFRYWIVGRNRPIQIGFHGPPGLRVRVFVGLKESHWQEPGHRLVDVSLNNDRPRTLDTFAGAPHRAHGLLLDGALDGEGNLLLTVAPNPESPDLNPTCCGALLFPAELDIDLSDVISGEGPAPLAAVGPGIDRADAMRALLQGRGRFFARTSYTPEPLPDFSRTRPRLPQPVFDELPAAVDAYWRAWELAFTRFRQPQPGSPFVSNYIDEAFNDSLFLWDTCFMTMFCNYAHAHVPGIQSLDNFYCTQLADGEIVREISELTGEPNYAASEPGTPHSLNHPILAWAELEAYRVSGDRERLALVYPALAAYYRAYGKIRDPETGLYLGTWASMDNSPRVPGMHCGLDTSAEVALFARNLAEIADVLGKPEESSRYGSEAHELGGRINERLWDPQAGFYFDWGKDGTRHNVWTIAAFWPMLAGIASESQVDGLAAHLEDPRKFARIHRVPTVPADQEGYDPTGGYWRGAVWAPTDMMVVRGLERCGRHDLAHAIAMNHLRNVTRVFEETGTLWENYAPDSPAPGLFNGNRVAPDFVGWTGIGPIVFLIEHGIGLHVDAPARRITWRVRSRQRIGVQGLQFGDTLVDLICEPANQAGTREIRVHAGGEFELEVRVGDEPRIFRVPPRTEVVYRVDSETGAAARDHGDPP